jgi:hypothetical protein
MEQSGCSWMRRIAVVSLSFVALFSWAIFCRSETYDLRAGANQMPGKTINEILEQHSKVLMSIPGVVGAGQGLCEGKPCIKVFVIRKTVTLDQKIPGSIEGYPVVIEEIGEVKARPKE